MQTTSKGGELSRGKRRTGIEVIVRWILRNRRWQSSAGETVVRRDTRWVNVPSLKVSLHGSLNRVKWRWFINMNAAVRYRTVGVDGKH